MPVGANVAYILMLHSEEMAPAAWVPSIAVFSLTMVVIARTLSLSFSLAVAWSFASREKQRESLQAV